MRNSLMTNELRDKLPALYSTENEPLATRIVHVAYMQPDSSWYWYPLEFDGSDLFFGLVVGQCAELGYFRLSELEQAIGPWQLRIVRCTPWQPITLEEVIRLHPGREGIDTVL